MPLVDTGLVCRYYFDEAASGTTPTQVDDTSSNAYHLTEINYGSGNMAYTEVGGNRGLESTSASGAQRIRETINDTSDAFRDAIIGSTDCTLELVFDPDAFTINTSRVAAINDRVGSAPRFGLAARDTNDYVIYFNGGASVSINPAITTRMVMHIVLDTTNATQDNRIRYSINGGALTGGLSMALGDSSTISAGNGHDLIFLNRESSSSFDRSMDGILYYAAWYSSVFSAANITTNYDILTLDDDEPSSASISPLAGRHLQNMMSN